MAYRLFVNSSVGVSINPDYGFMDKPRKIENRYRSRDATEFVYKWADYDGFHIPVSFVDSSFRAIVNSWWRSNTDLMFKSESETQVYSVHIIGNDIPVTKRLKPYDNLFAGVIKLETY